MHSSVSLLAAASLLALSPTALAVPTLSTTHATVKVRPNQPAPDHLPAALIAARNEFASFQIVLAGGDRATSNVSAQVGPLEGPGPFAADNVKLFRQAYLNLTKMSFTKASPGLYPDALVPDVDEVHHEKRNAFPFAVPANETRAIWVDVLVPKGTAPGDYQGSILVTGEGLEQPVPFTLTVVDAELPSTASLTSAFLFNRYESCMAHAGRYECGEQYGAQLRAMYARFALDHRITLSNIGHFPSGGNWSAFDAVYRPLMDGTADTRLEGAQMTSLQYPGARNAAGFIAFTDHMRSRGWLARAYDYSGDEPPYGISYSEALSRVKAVKQAAPELRTLLTATIQQMDQYGISSFLDLVVPVVNHLDGAEGTYRGNQRPAYDPFLANPTKQLWTYQSCMSHGCAFGTNAPAERDGSGWPSYMVDASAARNRGMQWVAFAREVTGELYYETALALPSAWETVFRFAGNGDGTLFYPGTPARIGGTTDTPVASIRLKQIRQGMQDYEWLKLVSDAGDPAFAHQVARTLIPSAHQVGDDGLAFEQARRELITRWHQLTQPDVPTSPKPPKGGLVTPPAGGDNVGGGGGILVPGERLPAARGKVGCSAAAAGIPLGAWLFAAAAVLGRRPLSGRRRSPR